MDYCAKHCQFYGEYCAYCGAPEYRIIPNPMTPITKKIAGALKSFAEHAVFRYKCDLEVAPETITLIAKQIASLIEKPEPMNDSGSSKPRLPIESVAQKPAELNPTKGWTPEVDEAARKAEKIFAPKEESSMWWEEEFDTASRRWQTEYGIEVSDNFASVKSFIRAELARQREEADSISEEVLDDYFPRENARKNGRFTAQRYMHILLARLHDTFARNHTP